MKAALTASLLAFACSPRPDPDVSKQVTVPEDSLVLERTMCLGTCPAYRLRVSSAGEVRFDSRNPGEGNRMALDTTSAGTLSSLVSMAHQAGFFELPYDILHDRALCPIARTDAPTVTTSIFARDSAKAVKNYHGCVDSTLNSATPQLVRLRAFETEIDSALKSSRWVRPASRR